MMRLPAILVIGALAVLIGLTPESSSPAQKSSGSSKPRGPSSGSGPGIFFPPSGYRPWNPNGNSAGRNFRLGNGARIVPVRVDFTVTFNTDVGKVRSIDPPDEYDDKGNVRKPTREDLKRLKGDTPEERKMVGYKSDFSELQSGDIVQVAVSVHKKDTSKASPSGTEGDRAATEEGKQESKPGKWIVAGILLGKVTKIENANTDTQPKITVQVTQAQIVQQGQRTPGNRQQRIGQDQAQATVILIGHRPVGPPKPGG
jgi:hypothetical protein